MSVNSRWNFAEIEKPTITRRSPCPLLPAPPPRSFLSLFLPPYPFLSSISAAHYIAEKFRFRLDAKLHVQTVGRYARIRELKLEGRAAERRCATTCLAFAALRWIIHESAASERRELRGWLCASRASTAGGVNFFSNIPGSTRSCRFRSAEEKIFAWPATVNRGFTFGPANYAPS